MAVSICIADNCNGCAKHAHIVRSFQPVINIAQANKKFDEGKVFPGYFLKNVEIIKGELHDYPGCAICEKSLRSSDRLSDWWPAKGIKHMCTNTKCKKKTEWKKYTIFRKIVIQDGTGRAENLVMFHDDVMKLLDPDCFNHPRFYGEGILKGTKINAEISGSFKKFRQIEPFEELELKLNNVQFAHDIDDDDSAEEDSDHSVEKEVTRKAKIKKRKIKKAAKKLQKRKYAKNKYKTEAM